MATSGVTNDTVMLVYDSFDSWFRYNSSSINRSAFISEEDFYLAPEEKTIQEFNPLKYKKIAQWKKKVGESETAKLEN